MIAATLKGPGYEPINYDFDTIEVFDTLEDVIEALFERYSANGQRQCDSFYLDGHEENVIYPTFGEGMTFTCYRTTPIDEADEDEVEGRRLEVHTAVHGGWHDYTVTLVEGEVDGMIVTVRKAGL